MKFSSPKEWRDRNGQRRFHFDQCMFIAGGRIWLQVNWSSRRIPTRRLVSDAPNCYLRFGGIPPTGVSVNHLTGMPEAGVSVYHAIWFPSGLVLPWLDDEHASNDCAMDLQDRPAFIVEGTPCPTKGSDGEPLLHDAVMVSEVVPVMVTEKILAWGLNK